MDRKTFIKNLAGSVLVAAPIVGILGCTSDDNEGNGGGNVAKNCLANGTNSSIGSNHGHTLQVSKNDVNAGVEKQYDIKGSSPHAHTVTVSASNFATLKTNQQIQINSTNDDAHSHLITISCA